MEKLRKRRKRKRRSSGLFRTFLLVLVVFFVSRMFGTSILSSQVPRLRGAANRDGTPASVTAATTNVVGQSSVKAMEAASRAEKELLERLRRANEQIKQQADARQQQEQALQALQALQAANAASAASAVSAITATVTTSQLKATPTATTPPTQPATSVASLAAAATADIPSATVVGAAALAGATSVAGASALAAARQHMRTVDRTAGRASFRLRGQDAMQFAQPADQAGSITVSAWIFLSGDNKDAQIKTIVSNRESGCETDAKHHGYSLTVNSWETADQQLLLEFGSKNKGCEKLASGPRHKVPYDRWTHVAMTSECPTAGSANCQMALYIDGECVASRQAAGAARRLPQLTRGLRVGQFENLKDGFIGNISDVRIWSSARSTEQVLLDAATPVSELHGTGSTLMHAFPLSDAADLAREEAVNAVQGHPVGRYERVKPPPDLFRPSSGSAQTLGNVKAENPKLTKEERAKDDALGRERAKLVKSAMQHAWKGYREKAWGMDALKPVSGGGENAWGKMGMTLLDSLDTLWIMGMKTEFNEARNWVRDKLSFGNAGDVSVFETTIRALGGLLSAHSLSGDKVFLDKALDLGNRLFPAFNSPTGIPFGHVNLNTHSANNPSWSGGASVLAEFGTLQLEFRYLGIHAKRPDMIRKAEAVWKSMQQKQASNGLYPIYCSPQSGQFTSSKITFGAMGDSYYEYLLKGWVQSGRTEPYLRAMYDASMDGMASKMLKESQPSRLAYIAELEGGSVNPKMDHLVCFVPGMLALGAHKQPPGERRDRHMKMAKALMYTCWQMYDRMPTGVAPEYVTFRGRDLEAPTDYPYYLLRPETVESLFILQQLTGDPIYREWGHSIMTHIERYCRATYGYGPVADVRVTGRPPDDKMESFFLAETLKYLYMLQSPDHGISLDEYVINTEAHPLKIFDAAQIAELSKARSA